MSGFVDWPLAERVAVAAAGDSRAEMATVQPIDAAGERAMAAVLDYTCLRPAEPLPPAEWISRREWARSNVASMRDLIAPVENRLIDSPPPGGRAAAAVAGRFVAAEVGALVGFASRRVLGQYEFSMADPGRRPRLLFLGANIDAAAVSLPGEPDEVLEWVALHEGTHAAHFAGAPWLREHLAASATELLAGDQLRFSLRDLAGDARRFAGAGPREALASLRGADPMTLLAPPALRARIGDLQATMAAVEGYAEHVMDAAAGDLGAIVPRLREAMERRRQARNPIFRLISWLLGFEMKLRQYREGKRWADEVASSAGIAGLNEAWVGPESLPSPAEIADPGAWLRRVGPAASAAAA